MDRLALKFDMDEMIDTQIDYLKNTYPELEKTREDIKTIIRIESGRYENSKLRMEKIVSKLNQKPAVDDLIRLYESDGVTPDYLKEMNVISDIPSTFYSKLSELHQSKKQKEQDQVSLEGLSKTELLYYEDDPKEFDAKVIKSFDKYVVLDKTSFYARGGGQEPDHGTIEKFEVVDVSKHGNVIVHELKNGIPKEGSTVSCVVDSKRRDGITKNHTSTHILNSSTRSVLGSWVWQHSAFKEEDHARLDITHHSALTNDEIVKIEKLANSIVEKNMSVTIDNFDRGTAEQKYGFKIYQGGIVPVKSVRIVSIEDFDIEACGGTHVKKTGEIELIKITRTKRIQDGVVRIEFVSGGTALDYTKQHDANLIKKSAELKEKTELREKRRGQKQELREKFPILVDGITQSKIGTNIVDGIIVDMTDPGKPNFCSTTSDQYDEFFHISLGEKLIEKDPWMVYCGVFEDGDKVRAIIYSGEQAAKDKKAGDIAKTVSEILGGAGGGNQRFAQGGGKDKSKKNDAIEKAKKMVLEV
jgi:alanyl-tRNA synthetase